jgi:hypothetical protein
MSNDEVKLRRWIFEIRGSILIAAYYCFEDI